MAEERTPAPLRKIVGKVIPAADGYSRRKVELECGHQVRCSGSAIYRARCRLCRIAAAFPVPAEKR